MGIYAVSQASLSRMTLDKPITGTRVVNEQGKRPTLIQISVRALCRFIPFETFLALFVLRDADSRRPLADPGHLPRLTGR